MIPLFSSKQRSDYVVYYANNLNVHFIIEETRLIIDNKHRYYHVAGVILSPDSYFLSSFAPFYYYIIERRTILHSRSLTLREEHRMRTFAEGVQWLSDSHVPLGFIETE